jgi:hypothetical protein
VDYFIRYEDKKVLTESERCDILKTHSFDEQKAIAKRVAILNKKHLTN